MSDLHHIALTVSDLEKSAKFYGGILSILGFELGHSSKNAMAWHGSSIELILYRADHEFRGQKHSLYAPGFHHIGLNAKSRDVVKQIANWLKDNNGGILNDPCEYPNYPGDYYAVFFLDPDGLKLEVMTN